MPGSSLAKEATKVAGSHSGLNWVCKLPCGKTVSCQGSRLVETVGEPFSKMNCVAKEPEIRTKSSALRRCTCGVLKPQGPRNPTVMAAEVPMRAGNETRSAETVAPPLPAVLAAPVGGDLYEKMKSESERSLSREEAFGAERRASTRVRLFATWLILGSGGLRPIGGRVLVDWGGWLEYADVTC